MTSEEFPAKCVKATIDAFGQIDILVNNAGEYQGAGGIDRRMRCSYRLHCMAMESRGISAAVFVWSAIVSDFHTVSDGVTPQGHSPGLKSL